MSALALPRPLHFSRKTARVLTPLVILAAWELACRSGLLAESTLAPPSIIAQTLYEMSVSGQLLHHLGISLQRAAVGVGVGLIVGVTLALAAGLSLSGEVAVDPPMQMLRTLPFLALQPLFIMWFGVGNLTRLILIAYGTLFPIYLTLFGGIRAVDPKLVEAAKVFGLSRIGIIAHVIVPSALPSFYVGLRYALSLSWLGLVVVEQINVESGIGFLINQARDYMRTDEIVACLVVYAMLGLLIDALVRQLERLTLGWRPSFLKGA
jgi:sulfonate transport system permease protein